MIQSCSYRIWRTVSCAAVLLCVVAPATAYSQDSIGPSRSSQLQGPPVRRIESAQAISTEPLGAITSVRALSDGRVLLNDGTRRRLLMLDSTLTQVTVILDSLTEVANAYGTRAGTLLPFLGDSSVFIDPATYAMLILDRNGKIARVRAVPRALDIGAITNINFTNGVPGFDSQGRFVYRISATTAPPAVAPPAGMPYFPSPPDSAFIIGVNLNTRLADTLGVVRIPKVVFSMRMEPDGGYNINMVPNPLPLMDDWSLLSNGTVAFVRGVDYRVEFRAPVGTMTSSEKLPFPWVQMTDSMKEHYADSMKGALIKSAQTNFTTQMIAWSNLLNKPYPASFKPADEYVMPPGLPMGWILPKGVSYPPNYMAACAPGVTPSTPGMGGASALSAMKTEVAAAFGKEVPAKVDATAVSKPAGPANAAGSPDATGCAQTYFSEMYGKGYTPPAPIYRAPTLVRPRDLPDYRPPFGAGATRSDADGNLWIRTIPATLSRGGLVYDVVNSQGVLVDRIQLPVGYQLVGFGSEKLVFLSNRDATGLHLSRVRLK